MQVLCISIFVYTREYIFVSHFERLSLLAKIKPYNMYILKVMKMLCLIILKIRGLNNTKQLKVPNNIKYGRSNIYFKLINKDNIIYSHVFLSLTG